MQIRFRLAHDGIRPSLVRRLRRLEDPRPALEAAGLAIVSLAKRAFDEAGLRPAPWPPRKKRKGKKQPTHKLLKRTGTLWRSLRVIQALKTRVTVGTDRRYAAFHQLGTRHIPARPFFPFTEGRPTPKAKEQIEAALRRKLESLLK